MLILRFLLLYFAAHRAWPDYEAEKLAAACAMAVEIEDVAGVPAPLLLAIAQHESDLEPGAVSWRDAAGRRHDRVLVTNETIKIAGPLVCGYLSAMARDGFDCSMMIETTGGMLRGALEIREWLDTCRGDVRCALSGHAGGNAGMLAHREHRDTQATRFADLFTQRARVLGWR